MLNRVLFPLSLLISFLIFLIVVYRWQNTRLRAQRRASGSPPRALVVVLGDVGRSPRMQFHAVSLLELAGCLVDIVGYAGTPLVEPLQKAVKEGKVRTFLIEQPAKLDSSKRGSRVGYLVSAGIRILKQVLELVKIMLVTVESPDVILVQNPPAIPTLALVILTSRLRGSRLIIDWHNFAYTLMAINLGRSLIVRIAEIYEKVLGRIAGHVNLTVTKAMKTFLEKEMRVGGQVVTVYDRPPLAFHRLSTDQIRTFLSTLQLPPPLNRSSQPTLKFDPTANDRPALLVSSTSWTEDEDFGILLAALQEYDSSAPTGSAKLEVIVTGKGPLKAYFEDKISKLELKRVNIRTAWLEPGDYPLLLGSADLGISLHASSSGLDLPMKVVDMFGSGLAVAALSYPVLSEEMVRDGVNGVLFEAGEKVGGKKAGGRTLGGVLIDLFKEFPRNTKQLDQLRKHVQDEFREDGPKRWDASWKQTVLPLLGL